MTFTLGLGGDTMLGRQVGDRIARWGSHDTFSPEVLDMAREADLLVVNLECALSDRGDPWPDPRKPFFFRGPPMAVELLADLGVGCVTMANNHALDYGAEALVDTLDVLAAAGIAVTGAGVDGVAARTPAIVERAGTRVAVVGVADHPADFAAGPGTAGIAFADLRRGVPWWLRDVIGSVDADVVLVSPHWGPNMVTRPVRHVMAAAPALLDAGATVVAGHSAHVVHGVGGRVLFDLGDLVDDYARDPDLRNDLGLLFLVRIDSGRPVRLEAVPLFLDHCRTRLATGRDASWMERRFVDACAELGTPASVEDGRLVVRFEPW